MARWIKKNGTVKEMKVPSNYGHQVKKEYYLPFLYKTALKDVTINEYGISGHMPGETALTVLPLEASDEVLDILGL